MIKEDEKSSPKNKLPNTELVKFDFSRNPNDLLSDEKKTKKLSTNSALDQIERAISGGVFSSMVEDKLEQDGHRTTTAE